MRLSETWQCRCRMPHRNCPHGLNRRAGLDPQPYARDGEEQKPHFDQQSEQPGFRYRTRRASGLETRRRKPQAQSLLEVDTAIRRATAGYMVFAGSGLPKTTAEYSDHLASRRENHLPAHSGWESSNRSDLLPGWQKMPRNSC